eukprot:jgi/Hompol1/6526/HPOL_002280-RA
MPFWRISITHSLSERKVINKYYPSDFDPSKIPRRRVPKEKQIKVTLMAPFSMQCNKCGDYIYKGKKFNARKEPVENERYLGIRIFRFYIRCPKCASEITFKTDPKNADYQTELGAVRNFEPWRERDNVQEELESERMAEEENNPMRALENRTLESKREMDIMDALDEIRTKNAQIERVGATTISDKLSSASMDAARRLKQLQDEEDDRIAKAIFQTDGGEYVRRLDDDEQVDVHSLAAQSEFAAPSLFDAPSFVHSRLQESKEYQSAAAVPASNATKKQSKEAAFANVRITVKPKAPQKPTVEASNKSSISASKPATAVLGMLGSYGSDDDENQ